MSALAGTQAPPPSSSSSARGTVPPVGSGAVSSNGRFSKISEYNDTINWKYIGKVTLAVVAALAVLVAVAAVLVSVLAATNVMSFTVVPLIGNALAGTYGTVILTSIAAGGVALGAGLFAAQRRIMSVEQAEQYVVDAQKDLTAAQKYKSDLETAAIKLENKREQELAKQKEQNLAGLRNTDTSLHNAIGSQERGV